MNVLLAGGTSNFTDLMVNKLNKEGHRVYVLTGEKHRHSSYHKVFETYRFPYDNENVKEVFESVNPEIVLFMGAFDTNYEWDNARQESVEYSSGLLNLLISFSLLRKDARFFYLSSHDVFQGTYANDILEEEAPSARSVKDLSIALGEQMCKNYQVATGKDITVLRLDHMYEVPKNKDSVRDFYSKFCLEAFQSGRLVADKNKHFSLLYISDALEFIYKVIMAREHKFYLYNLTSFQEMDEMSLAELIKDAMGGNVDIVDNSSPHVEKIVLSGHRFDEEFGVNIFNRPERVIPKTIDYMRSHSKDFLDPEDDGEGFFLRLFHQTRGILKVLIPYGEAVAIFIPFFMLNNRAVGSQYFANLDFYLIYVLIFAIMYGQQVATFSAILATLGYCFRAMYSRSGFDVLVDYNTYVWIAQLFILGLVVGYLRDRIDIIQEEDEEELEHLTVQLGDIQDINNSNVRSKNILETEVINQSQSIGTVYEITSSLEQYAPEEVLFYAAEVLGRLMESKQVAIYSVANRSYARLFSATSPEARRMGNSVNYQELTDMYVPLTERKVYINKNMDDKYPLMANAIYSEDEMQLILMVWGIPWERMTLGQANLLTVIGFLIQNAVVRANRFMDALKNERYIEGTNILELDAFRSLVNAYLNAFHKGLAEFTLLMLEIPGAEQASAAEKLKTKLRQSDSIGNLEDGKLYVLLTNTPTKDADFVINRFRELGYESEIWEEAVV